MLDINYIRNTRGRLSAYIMALVAAFLGLHFAIFEGLIFLVDSRMFMFTKYDVSTATVIMILIILVCAINVVGAFFIRSKRIAGGIILLSSSIPLLIISIVDIDNFFSYIPTSLVCIAAAVLAFIPLPDIYLKNLSEKQQLKEDLELFILQRKTQQAVQVQSGESTVETRTGQNQTKDHQDLDW